MTCENSQQNLSAMVDGELADEDLAPTLAHASACPECRQFLGAVTRQPALLRSASPDDVPRSLDRRVTELARLDRGHRVRAPLQALRDALTMRVRIPVPVALGTAGLLLGLVIFSAVTWRTLQTKAEGTTRVVYMMEFPPVEVIAFSPASQATVQ